MTKKEFQVSEQKFRCRELSALVGDEFSADGLFFSPEIIKKKLGEDWSWTPGTKTSVVFLRLYDIIAKHRPEAFI